jgi:cyclophilin family peptidyl-prolyl cis-trans isomerase
MSKVKSLKKILVSFAIIGIAFSVSACTSKTDTADQNITPASAVDTTSEQNSNLAEMATTSAPVETSAVTDANQATATETSAVTNTIMSPDKQEDLTKTYSQAILKTSVGNITLKFYPSETPMTVNNFLNLANAGFYNGTKFHRVMKDFMIQGGDPLTKGTDASSYGTGGPGYQFKNEYGTHKLVAGSIAMANAGVDTNGSQFFIVTASSTPFLDGSYTNFGEVTDGMDVVRKIENSAVKQSANGEMSVPVDYITINSVELVK